MKSQIMDRHLEGAETMTISQSKKNCLYEFFLGCEVKTRFKYYKNGTEKIAESVEDSSCLLRQLLCGMHKFTAVMREEGSDEEIITMYRPLRCLALQCKCCCYQEMTVSSGGQKLGMIQEKYWYCVPTFEVTRADGSQLYKIHHPTCIGGLCVNCCAEGNPCFGRGCCKVPFHVFPYDQNDTDDGAPHIGKILKKMKGIGAELFTDSDVFEVTFPAASTTDEKALLIGSTIFFNALFFETQASGGD